MMLSQDRYMSLFFNLGSVWVGSGDRSNYKSLISNKSVLIPLVCFKMYSRFLIARASPFCCLKGARNVALYITFSCVMCLLWCAWLRIPMDPDPQPWWNVWSLRIKHGAVAAVVHNTRKKVGVRLFIPDSVAESDPGAGAWGAVMKLLSGAVIANYGSGFILFYQRN